MWAVYTRVQWQLYVCLWKVKSMKFPRAPLKQPAVYHQLDGWKTPCYDIDPLIKMVANGRCLLTYHTSDTGLLPLYGPWHDRTFQALFKAVPHKNKAAVSLLSHVEYHRLRPGSKHLIFCRMYWNIWIMPHWVCVEHIDCAWCMGWDKSGPGWRWQGCPLLVIHMPCGWDFKVTGQQRWHLQ